MNASTRFARGPWGLGHLAPGLRLALGLRLGLALALALGGCAKARVVADCDGGACGTPDAGCDGPECSGCPVAADCTAMTVCTETICSGQSYTCSYTGPGRFAWTIAIADCDDGDPCTDSDHCVGDGCMGTPRVCGSPPAATCVGTDTLRTYAATGSCADGTCTYPPTDKPCAADDCQDGTCSSDACAGVTCTTPGDPCLEESGTCEDGECVYPPKALDCGRPHATGGHCVDGECGGWTCVAPYENCDDDWANGCEIPVGVASQCDAEGLNSTTGCGTAHCGASTSSKAHNFVTWYCISCSTCHYFDGLGWSWCLASNVEWSPQYCPTCCNSGSADLVCGP